MSIIPLFFHPYDKNLLVDQHLYHLFPSVLQVLCLCAGAEENYFYNEKGQSIRSNELSFFTLSHHDRGRFSWQWAMTVAEETSLKKSPFPLDHLVNALHILCHILHIFAPFDASIGVDPL